MAEEKENRSAAPGSEKKKGTSADSRSEEKKNISADLRPGEKESIGADQRPGEKESISADQRPGEKESIGADQRPGEKESIGADLRSGEKESISADPGSEEKKERGRRKGRLLVQLFLSTLYLSAFTFGGGYVIVTLMKRKFVDEYRWIDEKEMLDLIAIAQSSPGAIAVNGAIVVGYKLAGVPGVLTAVTATVLPPFAVLSAVSFFYSIFQKNPLVRLMLAGMQAGVGAVIAAVVYDMGAGIVKEKDGVSILIMLVSFLAAYFMKVNVIYIVIACGLFGAARTLLFHKHGTA